jgi:hypothetical protein
MKDGPKFVGMFLKLFRKSKGFNLLAFLIFWKVDMLEAELN